PQSMLALQPDASGSEPAPDLIRGPGQAPQVRHDKLKPSDPEREQFGLPGDAEPGVSALAISEHGIQADAQVERDALRGHSQHHTRQHFALARRQRAADRMQPGAEGVDAIAAVAR